MNFRIIAVSLLLIVLCSITAYASNEEIPLLHIDSCDEKVVTYSINGIGDDETVYAISALYKAGIMVDINVHPCSLRQHNEPFTDVVTEDYDTVKVFLWDAETLSPICKAATTEDSFTVIFKNDNGDIIATESVKWGRSCPLPEAPEKEGYIFKGWSGDYINIKEDTVITAEYIEETEANIFVVSGGSGKAGDTVTISVDLDGTVDLCGFDMRLIYDKNLLEYISLDPEFSFDILANHIASSNSIRFNFSSTKNRNRGGTVLQVTFRIKDTANADSVLKLIPIEVLVADAQTEGKLINANHSVTEGVVFVNEN